MIRFPRSEVEAFYAVRVPKLQQRGKRWRGPCPIHDGEHDSFSVDSEAGLWRCHSSCGRSGDIIGLEIALTGATWRDAVIEIERIVGRRLLERPQSRADVQQLAERRARERRETRAAGFFKIGAEKAFEHVLDELPEAVAERFGPSQALLELKQAGAGRTLVALYRDWRSREPHVTAALVYAGERAWDRLCTRLAQFVDSGAEVPHVS
jgi:DNA primase